MTKSGDRRGKIHTRGHCIAAMVIEEGLCCPCHETQLAGSSDICLMVVPPAAAVKLGSGHLNTSPHTVQYTDTSPCQIQLASLCHENRSYLLCHHPSSALLLAPATRGEQETNIRWSVKLMK